MGGWITSGVVRYYKVEVQRLPRCSNTASSPGPRHESGDGEWLNFPAGAYAWATAIEVGPDQRTYFDCLLRPAPQSGELFSGVKNPSRFEMRGLTLCENTSNWNPGPRIESGDGSLPFNAGDRVVASFIVLSDGSQYPDPDSGLDGCFFSEAPMAGTLYGGVRDYWPGEDADLPPCQ